MRNKRLRSEEMRTNNYENDKKRDTNETIFCARDRRITD